MSTQDPEIGAMHDDSDIPDNIDRLLSHLNEDSLAAGLVHAHRTQAAGNPRASMKSLLAERLKQVREKLDAGEDLGQSP